MGNHVHLILAPEKGTGLARVLGRTHTDYARWLNLRRGETGHPSKRGPKAKGGVEDGQLELGVAAWSPKLLYFWPFSSLSASFVCRAARAGSPFCR